MWYDKIECNRKKELEFWNSESIKSPQAGLEPTTSQLTADRSTTELLRGLLNRFSNAVYESPAAHYGPIIFSSSWHCRWIIRCRSSHPTTRTTILASIALLSQFQASVPSFSRSRPFPGTSFHSRLRCSRHRLSSIARSFPWPSPIYRSIARWTWRNGMKLMTRNLW